jgi:hypothetical protein
MKHGIVYYRKLIAGRPTAELNMLQETYQKLNSMGVRNRMVQELISIELKNRLVFE